MIAALIAVGVVAGALAYWTGSGSGSASTTLGNPLALTLSPGTPSDPLAPRDVAGVAVVAENPNPYQVHVGSLSLDDSRGSGGFDVDSAHSGCDLAVLGFTTADNGGNGWNVPPKIGSTNGSEAIELGHALSMSDAAADACQGASFTIHLLAGA